MCTPLWFANDDLLWLAGTTLHGSMIDRNKSAAMKRSDSWLNEWTAGRDILKGEGVDIEPYTWYVLHGCCA